MPAATGTLALALALVPQSATASDHVERDRQHMYSFATGEVIPDSRSVLKRFDDDDDHGHHDEERIASRVRTKATPRHALTMWYVVFNEPGACSDGECGEDDIFKNGDMAMGPNLDAIEHAEVSVVFAGAGRVANRRGWLRLRGGLGEDEVPDGDHQVVIGRSQDGALIESPVTGITDVDDAEVHIVLQDHGSAHSDPARRAKQLSGFQTECNPVCEDVQFTIHKAD